MNRPFIHKAFEPRRTANWNIQLGFYHGRGLSSVAIAQQLGDGTGPATVRTMIQGASLPSPGARMTCIPVDFECWQRDAIASKAAEIGITINELLWRMSVSGLVLDDLYDAVTDGRYS